MLRTAFSSVFALMVALTSCDGEQATAECRSSAACGDGLICLNGSCVAPTPCESGDAEVCGAHGTCMTTSTGSFCGCDAGYAIDVDGCSDVDECAAGTDDCDANATCTNSDGSFTCACNAGYDGDGRTCADVDECTAGTDDCDANATCANSDGSFTCACNAGQFGDGRMCHLPRIVGALVAGDPGRWEDDTFADSCASYRSPGADHEYAGMTGDGVYEIDPDGAGVEPSFEVYCDMTTDGGGWTLLLSEGLTFDRNGMGSTATPCYEESCTSRAYSTVPIRSDLMIDAAGNAIVEDQYEVRVRIDGVHASVRGRTLRTAMTGMGMSYVDLEDNSNVTVTLLGGAACSTIRWSDFRAYVCTTSVLTLADPGVPGCLNDATVFALGGSVSYTQYGGNCEGWPEGLAPNSPYWPPVFRFWAR